jgi:hypothetical protein
MVYLKSLDPNILKKNGKNDYLNSQPEKKELPPVKTHRRPLYRPETDQSDDVSHQNFIIFA